MIEFKADGAYALPSRCPLLDWVNGDVDHCIGWIGIIRIGKGIPKHIGIAMTALPGKFRLVAFDLDGTLTVEVSSWQSLPRFFGTERSGEVGLKDYELGKISYEEFMRRDIACWPKGLKIDSVERILSTSTLRVDRKSVG
jgi:hypothetical protein